MQPAPAIVKLRNRVADEYVSEKKKIYRLREYDEIIHLIKNIIGYINPMHNDNDDAKYVSYTCEPFLNKGFKGSLCINTIYNIYGIGTIN